MQSSPALEFVSYDTSNGKGKRRGNAARAHAAKVGWLKSARAAEIEARRKKNGEVGSRIAHEHHGARAKCTHQGTCFVDGTSQGKEDEAHVQIGEEKKKEAVQFVPRPISPTWGTIELKTFDASTDRISARVGHLMATTIWPCVAGEDVSKPWFTDFCNHPLLFHAHCTSGAIYRDFLAQKQEWSLSNTAITHKLNTLSLIQDNFAKLDKLSDEEIERLIFSMMILSCHEFEPKHLEEKHLPFSPHFPFANFFATWGRFDPVQAHEQAALALIQRQGGLHALKLPGLGFMAALTDILRAAVHLRKPIFPCFWEAHIFDIMPKELRRPYQDLSPSLQSQYPGEGFTDLPGGLPQTALSVFTEIACLDKVMSFHHYDNIPIGGEVKKVLTVRNSTIHKLLSLPSWDELEDPGTSYRAVYEVCRLTCILYSNAAIFPLPPHNGWNQRLTDYLVELLKTTHLETWQDLFHIDVTALYLWTLFIGGMVAYGTSNRRFFEKAIRRYISERGLAWSEVKSMMRTFVWADHVCAVGAMALWDAAMVQRCQDEDELYGT